MLLLALAMMSARVAHAAPNDGTADPATVDDASRERSRAAFRRGVDQLRAQQWAAARTSFEEAWSLVQHPSILLNLGIARLRTGDPVLAEQDLTRFLEEDKDASPDELASARDALAEARSKIGTIRVTVSPQPSHVFVDGKPVAVRAEGPTESIVETRVVAGKHTLRLEREGSIEENVDLDVPAKGDREARINLKPSSATPGPEETSPSRKIFGGALAGLSGVALVATGVMGIRAISLSNAYGDSSDPSYQKPDTKSQGIAMRTGADVALAVGLLAAGGAIVLLFTDVGKPSRSDTARAEHRFAVRVTRAATLEW